MIQATGIHERAAVNSSGGSLYFQAGEYFMKAYVFVPDAYQVTGTDHVGFDSPGSYRPLFRLQDIEPGPFPDGAFDQVQAQIMRRLQNWCHRERRVPSGLLEFFRKGLKAPAQFFLEFVRSPEGLIGRFFSSVIVYIYLSF
jgi:hypothetical protein